MNCETFTTTTIYIVNQIKPNAYSEWKINDGKKIQSWRLTIDDSRQFLSFQLWNTHQIVYRNNFYFSAIILLVFPIVSVYFECSFGAESESGQKWKKKKFICKIDWIVKNEYIRISNTLNAKENTHRKSPRMRSIESSWYWMQLIVCGGCTNGHITINTQYDTCLTLNFSPFDSHYILFYVVFLLPWIEVSEEWLSDEWESYFYFIKYIWLVRWFYIIIFESYITIMHYNWFGEYIWSGMKSTIQPPSATGRTQFVLDRENTGKFCSKFNNSKWFPGFESPASTWNI